MAPRSNSGGCVGTTGALRLIPRRATAQRSHSHTHTCSVNKANDLLRADFLVWKSGWFSTAIHAQHIGRFVRWGHIHTEKKCQQEGFFTYLPCFWPHNATYATLIRSPLLFHRKHVGDGRARTLPMHKYTHVSHSGIAKITG